MKRLKKWIAIALGATTLLCTCACAPQGETDGPVSDVGNGAVAPITPDTIVHAGGAYKMDAGKTIGFLSSEIETTSDGAAVEGVTVQLTATVEPADAWNKEVDWSFAWAEDAPTEWSSKPAENYIKIEPLTDGSTTANVTLTDYFHACAITIMVTTRDGGFTSSCDATCVSEYYETKITMNGTIAGTDRLGHQYYELYSGNTLNFTYKHYNKFGYEYANLTALHLEADLVAMFRGKNGALLATEEYTRSAFRWVTMGNGTTYPDNGIGGTKDYYFYNPSDHTDRTATNYLIISIDDYNSKGYIKYVKPFDYEYKFDVVGDAFSPYVFDSFDVVNSDKSTGGIEFAFSEYDPEADTYNLVTDVSYIKLRTSVSSVSLSKSSLALR